jgi:hypothetical protein
MRCHACNTEVALAPGRRVGFRDECERCRADLHVCLNCAHHDPTAYNECREPGAERVAERTRANRCDWFQPGAAAQEGGDSTRSAALADLERLFGDD